MIKRRWMILSKIVFFCIPAHGHTNPTLNVVRQLISEGHTVRYYSYNNMREKIEATKAEFIPCDDYDTEQKLSPKDAAKVGKDLAFSTKLLIDTTLALDDKIYDDMKEFAPDCIVADSMAVWGKAIALKMGIPFISSTTTFAFNEHSAKILKQSFKDLLKMIFSMGKINKDIERLKNKGYPINNVLDIIQNNDKTHTIVYTSPEFQPCSETFSDKYAFVGPSIRPSEDNIEKTKEKLIYISMGTVNNDMLTLYKRCLRAFSKTDHQVIMSVGDKISIDDLGKIPDNISVFSHVDQIAVLKKADVFISHCGMNSVSESLYFGVPLIMLPQTTEQKGVCERVMQLGAGIKLKKTDPSSFSDAVEDIIKDERYRKAAVKISESFKRCSGAKGAADKILKVCKESI